MKNREKKNEKKKNALGSIFVTLESQQKRTVQCNKNILKYFPNFLKDITYRFKKQSKPPNRIYTKESMTRHILIRLQKTEDKKIVNGR